MCISPFFAKGLKQPKRSDFCSRTFKSVADVVKSDPDLTRSGLVLGSSYSNLVRSVCNEKKIKTCKDLQQICREKKNSAELSGSVT